jgi:hypothetical protein
VSVRHEYFVVSPTELAALDLSASPVGQVADDRAAELPGVDPDVVLVALARILAAADGEPLPAPAPGRPVFDGGPDGPWVTPVDAAVVEAIQGADGDPELEWDDVAAIWSRTVGEDLGDETDEDALLELADELRRLCGQVAGERRLYAWTAR